jgi:glyoxylase-like metal-dependent hydrolase (beta-lactamase superfamily II)
MLRWEQIAKDFIAISVGKEYGGKPYYWTTFYYYKGLVIDTGCSHTSEEAAKFIEDMKLHVKAVFLTHHHEDHCGGASTFKERFGVEVFAPRKSLEILANPPEVPAYRRLVWGQPKPVKAAPLKDVVKVDDLTVKTFETPGHSFDSVSFLVEGCLFIGDLVTNPSPVVVTRDENIAEIVNSLRIVADLDFKKAYGGHGVWDKNALIKVSDNILALKANVDALWRRGLSKEQIVERLFSKVPKKVLEIEVVSQGQCSRKNLVEALLKMGQK